MAQIDRNSLQDAQKIVENFLPNEQARKKFINFLGNAINFANSIKPNNWMLNLDTNGSMLRLNIGREYCITLRKDRILILCDRTTIKSVVERENIPVIYHYDGSKKGEKAIDSRDIDKIPDAVVLTKNSIGCKLKNEEIERYIDFFSQSNKDFIKSAMNTYLLPQYKKAHSQGAVEYILKEFGKNNECETLIYHNIIETEYLENKLKLKKYFSAAYVFLENIENKTTEGFYVGTSTNLHLYYKNSLLFYFEFLSNTSVKIGKIKKIIKKNTKLDYVYFFESLHKNFESSELKDYEEFEFNKKQGKYSLIINNSENCELIFNLICKTLNEIKNGDFQYNIDFSDVQQEFEEKVRKAQKLSDKQLEKKLLQTQKDYRSETKIVQQIVHNRNEYVKVFVLRRAKGYCEKCGKFAPFLKDDEATPFLEVHHIMPLSEGGKDIVKNAIALCPNCHRHAHYGKKTFNNS